MHWSNLITLNYYNVQELSLGDTASFRFRCCSGVDDCCHAVISYKAIVSQRSRPFCVWTRPRLIIYILLVPSWILSVSFALVAHYSRYIRYIYSDTRQMAWRACRQDAAPGKSVKVSYLTDELRRYAACPIRSFLFWICVLGFFWHQLESKFFFTFSKSPDMFLKTSRSTYYNTHLEDKCWAS